MADYKRWTDAERNVSYRKSVEAVKAGTIPSAKEMKCSRCGQEEGLIHYHNHNYDHPTDYLEPLCWTCHMVLHSIIKFPEEVNDYWSEIFRGKRYPPVFTHSYPYLLKVIKNLRENGPDLGKTDYVKLAKQIKVA